MINNLLQKLDVLVNERLVLIGPALAEDLPWPGLYVLRELSVRTCLAHIISGWWYPGSITFGSAFGRKLEPTLSNPLFLGWIHSVQ